MICQVSTPLLAKDDKGKSKLLELMTKSEAPPPPLGPKLCPSGCGFVVTWHSTHCCQRCVGEPGKHGSKCDRKDADAVCEEVEKAQEKTGEQAQACADLVDKLCAGSDAIKAAVVSTDTFLALAKPATAGVALMLIEEKGLEISDEVSELACD